MSQWEIKTGDCVDVMRTMAEKSVNCCITSPPYFGLRDYGCDGQIGLESTPDAFVGKLVEVFREVRRVLRDDGTLWLNLGDSYTAGAGSKNGLGSSGLKRNVKDEPARVRCCEDNKIYRSEKQQGIATGVKPKDLLGIPWRVAFALQADGWYLRQDIIWHKPNPMPESVTDRCTKAHEYLFLMAKSQRYWFDSGAMKEKSIGTTSRPKFGGIKHSTNEFHGGGVYSGKEYIDNGTRNRRSVWTVCTKPFKGAHFATFPPKLIEPCVLAGCPAGGTVLDPFNGAGTTGVVAKQHGRNYVGIELNPAYVAMAQARIEAA